MFAGIVECPVAVLQVADGQGQRRLVLDLAPLRTSHRVGGPAGSGSPGAGGPAGPAAGRHPSAPSGGGESARGGPIARLGDSVAVNGVCLTVAALGPSAAPGAAAGHAGREAADRDHANQDHANQDHANQDLAAFDVVAETLARTNLGALVPGDRVNVERSLRYGEPVDGHLVSGHVEGTGEVVSLERRGGDVRLAIACGSDFAARLLPKGAVAVDGVSLTIAELGADRFTLALVPHTLEWTTLGALRPGSRVNLEPDLVGQWVLRAVGRLGLPAGG